MIDIENELFDILCERLQERFSDEHPDLFITGEYVMSPPSFPCISLVEIDNAVFKRTLTSEARENHVAVVYEVNIYSNKVYGKKEECKEIAGFIDDVLAELNFRRIMLEPIPNMNDTTIYRMLGRYRAVVSKDNLIYRR